jgi:voltage-gated sodium channel
MYFVSFVLVGTMVMLNLFIGVIISSMQEAQADAQIQITPRPDREVVRELADLSQRIDGLRERLIRQNQE